MGFERNLRLITDEQKEHHRLLKNSSFTFVYTNKLKKMFVKSQKMHYFQEYEDRLMVSVLQKKCSSSFFEKE